MSKSLTWDQLADLYHKKTGGQARTKPMDTIFEWAENQKEIHLNITEGTLHFKEETDAQTKT